MAAKSSDAGAMIVTGIVGVSIIGFGILALSGPKGRPSGAPSLPDSSTITVVDIEALARMFASENPSGSRRLQVKLAWTQIRSLKRGESIYHRVTAGSGWGAQGERNRSMGGGVRPVATDKDATEDFRELARRILLGEEVSSLTGARAFFDPDQQDRAFLVAQRARAKLARGEILVAQEKRLLGYKLSAEAVRARWTASGQRRLDTIDGVEFYS